MDEAQQLQEGLEEKSSQLQHAQQQLAELQASHQDNTTALQSEVQEMAARINTLEEERCSAMDEAQQATQQLCELKASSAHSAVEPAGALQLRQQLEAVQQCSSDMEKTMMSRVAKLQLHNEQLQNQLQQATAAAASAHAVASSSPLAQQIAKQVRGLDGAGWSSGWLGS